MTPVNFTLLVRTRNPLNGSQGFSRNATFAAARERKSIRQTAKDHTTAMMRVFRLKLPIYVHLTRVSSGKLDAWDGLPGALKPVVDGIADAFGVRDDDERITWERPDQRKGKRGEFAVEVRIGRPGA